MRERSDVVYKTFFWPMFTLLSLSIRITDVTNIKLIIYLKWSNSMKGYPWKGEEGDLSKCGHLQARTKIAPQFSLIIYWLSEKYPVLQICAKGKEEGEGFGHLYIMKREGVIRMFFINSSQGNTCKLWHWCHTLLNEKRYIICSNLPK